MATEEELANALRNADAAGDTEAAQQLANAIIEMRQSAAATPPDDAPFLIRSLSTARDLMPGISHIEPFARGALSTLGLGVPADVAGTAVGERIGQGIALAAGRKPAPASNLDELVAGARERGAELREEYPVTSLAGAGATGVGAVRQLGAKLIGKTALGRAGVGAGIAGAEGALFAASEKGEGVVRDAAWSAVLGGGIGAAAPPVINGIRQFGGSVLRRFFKNRAAVRLAMTRVGMAPDDIEKTIRQFEGTAKREASILDVSRKEGALETQRIAQRSSEAQRTIEEASEARAARVQESLPGAVLERRPVITPGQLARSRKAEFETAFNPIREEVIDYRSLSGTQRQTLANASDAISQPLPGFSNLKTAVRAQRHLEDAEDAVERASSKRRQAIDRGDEEMAAKLAGALSKAENRLAKADAIAKEFPVTMDAIENARFDLSKVGQVTIAGKKKGQITLDASSLRRAVSDIGEERFPEYGLALKTYAARSQRLASAFGSPKTGEGGTILPSGLARRVIAGGGDPDSLTDAIVHATPAAKQGTALGTMQLMARAAQKSPEDSAKLVSALSRNRSMQRALRSAVGSREAKRVIDLAKMENAANVNFRIAGTGARKTGSDMAAQEASEGLRAMMIPKAGGAMMANLAKDIGDTILVPPGAAERFARNMVDPNRAAETIKAMRKMAENDEAVLDLIRRNAIVASMLSAPVVSQTTGDQ